MVAMTWSKFDDQFYLNPKNAAIDRDEQDLNIAGIIYCNGQLTDGFIPSGALPMLCAWAKIDVGVADAIAIAKRLVEHSYWLIVDGGYKIHDFLDWNVSREEVEARRKERSESGRRGGLAKAKAIAKREPKRELKLMPSKTLPRTSTLIQDDDLLNTPVNNDLDLNKTINTETPVLTDKPPFNFSMRVWNNITGMVSVPAGQSDRVIPALEALYYQLGRDENRLIEYLKPYYQAWINRKTKDGLPYSRANCTWLYDWAIAGEIPQQSTGEPKPKPKRNAGLRARAGMEDDE